MDSINIIKFVRDGDRKQFREIWFEGGQIIMNKGIIGKKGKVTFCLSDLATARVMMNSFRAQAKRDGYVELSQSMTIEVVIKLDVHGFGTVEQLQTRHIIEEEIDQVLGWTGNGQCTGGNAGGGDMRIFCETVSAKEAIISIESVLSKHRHLFNKICVE